MLDKQTILNKTNNGFEVFRFYVSTKWQLGKSFLNPLYADNKASCNIYFDRSNRVYKMKDFGNDDYSGDCFFFVGKLKNLDCSIGSEFIKILKIINNDMSLGLEISDNRSTLLHNVTTHQKTITPDETQIKTYSIKERKFSMGELAYWEQFGITIRILKLYNAISLQRYESESNSGKSFTLNTSDSEPIFGYIGKNHIKIYRPFSKIRFLYGGELDSRYCFGLEQLPTKGDILFITGGEKDVMTLASQGFNAICFNSETSNISIDIIRKLSYRFKHIVILYDMDTTGLESSEKHVSQLSEFNSKRLLLPLQGTKEEKDISDYFRLGYTRNDFLKIFSELLDSLYSETMAILKSCEIDFNNPPPSAEVLISINEVPLGTEGNLLCITGGEGTGKSNYVGSIIAGAIKDNNSTIDTLGTEILNNTSKKAVLLYDTEQSGIANLFETKN